MIFRFAVFTTIVAVLTATSVSAAEMLEMQGEPKDAVSVTRPEPPPVPHGILSGDSAYVDWYRSYTGTDTIALVADVATDSYGSVFVTGLNWSGATGDVGVTIKYDAIGNEKFKRIFDARSSSYSEQDDPVVLLVDGNGSADMFCLSNLGGTDGWGMTFVQYDNTSPRRWVRRYDSEPYADELATSMAIDAAGSLYGVGYRNRAGYVTDIAVAKCNSRGLIQWTATLTDSLWGSFPAKVVVTPDGSRTYIGGYRWSENERNALVLALDANGKLLWTVNWNGKANNDDRILDICIDPSGNVIAVGATKAPWEWGYHDDFLVMKINPNGRIVWQYQLGFAENLKDEATNVVADASGNISVVGSGDTPTGTITHIISYSPDGRQRWSTEYATGLSWTFARPCGAKIDLYGNLLVGGVANHNDQSSLFAIRLDQRGSLVWEAFHGGDRPIYATAITIDCFGGVIMTGQEDYEPGGWVNKRGYVTVRFAQAMKAPKVAKIDQQLQTLSGCYPNPFNPTTTISYQVPVAARVSLRVYDILGREMRNLVDDYQEAGRHRVEWDGRDADNRTVSTGVYFYRLSIGKQAETGKMLLLK